MEKKTKMGKKLAIQGHSTRGKEVIELLEMMGGKDAHLWLCIDSDRIYYISDGYVRWDYIDSEEIDKYKIFTLEEFLEKYPFKVGDTVTLDNKLCFIMWMCWECNNIYYQVRGIDDIFTKKVTANEL